MSTTTIRHRGFTLWEMLTVIILLGAIGLILSRLFHATFRVIDTAPRARDEIVRVEAMLTQMRDDVWRAREVRVESPANIGVDQTTWTIGDSVVTRSSGDEVREWRPITAKLSFGETTGGVLLHSAPARSESDDSIVLANHARLLAGNRGAR
jgi:prepilin-type N-terminal cleavage/methylation domain-containing protein